ncbi:MAG: hypothetical protein JW839_07010 [Candidatus Lokiarchaeota archaeon]|nr:hypothetical protein [Candidatus Lokiarchaeota archaeon]
MSDLNLVPTKSPWGLSYWCTWGAQNVAWMDGLGRVEPSEMEGAAGAARARASLDEGLLLGKGGWARRFFQRARADLYIVLDDGWDAPPSGDMVEHLSSMILHPGRFPSHQRGPPAQRLRSLNDAVKAAGWRGIGIWLPANESGPYMDARPDMEPEDYWRERLEWSREAGIEYWKVDWGLFSGNHDFRRMLTRLGKEIHPALCIEHSVGSGMFNGPGGRVDPRWIKEVVAQAEYASVIRLYDVSTRLAIPTMLDRVQATLQAFAPAPGHDCWLNAEDEGYIGAALGCTLGIMRHPQLGKPRFPCPDGIRNTSKRLLEVDRALNWHRLAPPFPAGIGGVMTSDEVLTDSWTFSEGETWDRSVIGRRVEQAAPAIISRNVGLPRVIKSRDGDVPFVVAARNPNGAVSIAALGRLSPELGFRCPAVAVEITVEDITGPIGIFGKFKEVTFACSAPGRDLRSCTVWVQDLADSDAMNATAMVLVEKDSICITGGLINEAGSIAAEPGDESDPAVVLFVE